MQLKLLRLREKQVSRFFATFAAPARVFVSRFLNFEVSWEKARLSTGAALIETTIAEVVFRSLATIAVFSVLINSVTELAYGMRLRVLSSRLSTLNILGGEHLALPFDEGCGASRSFFHLRLGLCAMLVFKARAPEGYTVLLYCTYLGSTTYYRAVLCESWKVLSTY